MLALFDIDFFIYVGFSSASQAYFGPFLFLSQQIDFHNLYQHTFDIFLYCICVIYYHPTFCCSSILTFLLLMDNFNALSCCFLSMVLFEFFFFFLIGWYYIEFHNLLVDFFHLKVLLPFVSSSNCCFYMAGYICCSQIVCFWQSTSDHYAIGLKILNQLVSEMNQVSL